MEGLLYLEDGTVYKGKSFGAKATKVGELVFNTSMAGYQHVLTDPASGGEIVNMTYPLIGNCGKMPSKNPGERIHALGIVARDICENPNHEGCEKTLDAWLKEEGVPGIWNIDTRELTRKLRNSGTVKCVISTEGIALDQAKKLCAETTLPGDLMKTAGVKEITKIPAVFSGDPGSEYSRNSGPSSPAPAVAVVDLGVDFSLLEGLTLRGYDVRLFPYEATAEEILATNPKGVLIGGGPGNPKEAVRWIEETRKLVGKLPIFGISLGHQILALALGGETFALAYGHRGVNHGVYDKERDRAYVTFQNHSYSVKEVCMPDSVEITHRNLNDGSPEGMAHKTLPVFSVQFYPETAVGEGDSSYLFDKFDSMMKNGR